MRRLPVLLVLAVLLAGCPDREKTVEEIGGEPGRILEKMRDATERAHEEARERLEQLDD